MIRLTTTTALLIAIAGVSFWTTATLAHNLKDHVAVFPNTGYTSIAEGDDFPFEIDPLLPATDPNGNDVWQAIRDGAERWNSTRPGYPTRTYLVEREWDGTRNAYEFECDTAPECFSGGTLQYRINDSGECALFGSNKPMCAATTFIGGSTGSQEALTGSIVHEIGHGLAELAHPDWFGHWWGCYTVMGNCWNIRTRPSEFDQVDMKTVYHIPHKPIAVARDQRVIQVEVEHRSDSQNGSSDDFVYKFDLWRYNFTTSNWEFKHAHNIVVPDATPVGSTVTFSEDVFAEEGTGTYIYGVWVIQKLPGYSTATAQFGGFTNVVRVTGQSSTDNIDVHVTGDQDPVDACDLQAQPPSCSTLTYDVSVENHGSGSVSNIKVRVHVERWSRILNVFPLGICAWNAFGTSQTVNCDLGSLNPGGSTAVTIQVEVSGDPGYVMTTCAYVDHNNLIPESNELDNVDCQSTAVQ